MTSSTVVASLALAVSLAGCAGMHPHAMHNHGMVSVKSPHSAPETMTRLEAQVKQRGLVVVARVDHAAAAAKIGRALRPTELLIFGNPQAGTPLMECTQAAGIDLPMKALVWVDASSQVWLGYNAPAWVIHRHSGGDCPATGNVAQALAAIAAATVAP